MDSSLGISAIGFCRVSGATEKAHEKDRVEKINSFLFLNGLELLQDKGSMSKEQAIQKAEWKCEKYRVEQDKSFMSDFDQFVAKTRSLWEEK